MDVYHDFIRSVKNGQFWNTEDPVIIAVSGGVDSIVLLDLVSRLPLSLKPDLAIAHVDHQMREGSGEDALFVKKLAANYKMPVYVHEWPKETHPESGLEQNARKVRYAFFKRLADNLNSSTLLTAHHRDDQVETVLMRFIRGNSMEELIGIRSVREEEGLSIVRPLLPYAKSELIAYATEHHLEWREDETNKSAAFTRNRYRNTIIPLLKTENPTVEDHIIQFSKEINNMLLLITPLIEDNRKQTIQLNEDNLIIDRSAFLNLDAFMQEKVLANAVDEWGKNRKFLLTQKHLTLLRKWLNTSGPNSSLNLPNQLIARRIYDQCIIEETRTDFAQTISPEFKRSLTVGEWIQLSSKKKIGLLSYEEFTARETKDNDRRIYLNLKNSKLPLFIRHRQDGDKIKVKGLNGSKKVKDLFIDQKIPLWERDEAWIVTDSHEELLWIIDYKESTLSLNPITDTISYVLVYTDSNENN